MRTLKKTLSLVLVVAMVLGLCVVGASAKDAVENFTDDYQKVGAAYQEAVGVLVGVGIIDGMTETALEPQGTYTREQAAKIIAYMLLGKSKADSLKCTVAPFDDVAASRWSAGYIAFCVEQGIIDGMTATTYEPTGTLTGFQWAKMLLCAIGFGVKGEFTGSSWSVNTALVAHKVNLFAGDLDGADHTALRREQAALYAFNALNTAKVAYSPNVTSYVYGIQGYTTVNNIGSTLAKDVYDLKYAQGIVVDVEGNGAGYTVVSKDYSTANVTNKIKADNDIDMMYHAARVWYTGTNNGVYTYDLAKTTTYKCQEIAAGNAAANTAKAKTGLFVGDNSKTAYEAYLIDNSAVSAGSAYVKLYASAGSMGYVDAAKKTTSVVDGKAYTVPSANVRTDISNIKYGAPVVYVYTTSTTDKTLHGLYVYPMTSTTGTVKSIAKENGAIVSVTLADGTVLKQSVLANNAGDREYYVIGNTYTFVLDSHGHVMYATKDYARTLWAYTGEWRATGNYGDINTDRGREYRFINVSTGEFAFYPVRFVNRNDEAFSETLFRPAYGQYFDISATAGNDGRYVAELIEAGNDNTYAAGYIVATGLFKLGQNHEWYYVSGAHTYDKLYFNNETVKFLVAVGTGANMKVNSYTGVAALKEAYAVASNGMLELRNAAFTVTQTQTGHWNASTIFVMAQNLSSMSNYVFVPKDIASNAWSEVGGDVNSYKVVYQGAYLEGNAISIIFNPSQIGATTALTRGFYTMEVNYDRNGNPVYTLTEKIPNGNELCFYQNVSFTDTGVNGTWKFNNYSAVEGTTKVIDLTGNGIDSIQKLWNHFSWYGNLEFAFTVNPNTMIVDYVYVTTPGFQFTTTVSLSDALVAAGWTFKDGSTVLKYNDDDVVPSTYTIVNKNTKAGATTYKNYITVTDSLNSNAGIASAQGQADGSIVITYTPSKATINDRDVVVKFDGLKATNISFASSVTDVAVAADTTNYVFGAPLTVRLTFTTDDYSVGRQLDLVFSNSNGTQYNVTARTAVIASGNDNFYIDVVVYPVVNGTYTLTSVTAVAIGG